MGNVTENKKNKMTRIIDSAYELFKSKSFNSTTIDDVVKAAGVAKGTFYLYFSDKYDLLDRLTIEKSAVIFLDSFDYAFNDESDSFINQFEVFTDCVIDRLNEHKELTAMIQKNLSKCFIYLTETDDENIKSKLDYFISRMNELGFDKDRALKCAYLITDLIGSVCCDAVLQGKPYTLEEIRPLLHSSVVGILGKGDSYAD